MARIGLVYVPVAIVGIVGSGAYLRWAVVPCKIAYRIGLIIGRARARKTPAR